MHTAGQTGQEKSANNLEENMSSDNCKYTTRQIHSRGKCLLLFLLFPKPLLSSSSIVIPLTRIRTDVRRE
jgi:hypothetical protein